MNTLQKALQEYLAMRRALGFQLLDAGPALSDFVSFKAKTNLSYHHTTGVRVGPETWRSTSKVGSSIGFCSRFCPISECYGPSDGDSTLETFAISIKTGSPVLVHRR